MAISSGKEGEFTHKFTIEVTSFGHRQQTKDLIAETLARSLYLHFGPKATLRGYRYDPKEKSSGWIPKEKKDGPTDGTARAGERVGERTRARKGRESVSSKSRARRPAGKQS